jgi:hypothetical protein
MNPHRTIRRGITGTWFGSGGTTGLGRVLGGSGGFLGWFGGGGSWFSRSKRRMWKIVKIDLSPILLMELFHHYQTKFP